MKHPKRYDTDEKTSKRMANVRLKGGKAETLLAKKLWHKGYRYRLNYKKLPGSPDIAITKYRIAIFVDGEFWHGKDWQERLGSLKRNQLYWKEKIEENMERDMSNDKKLQDLDWFPIHFWEKDVLKYPDQCVNIIDEIVSDNMKDREMF